MGYQVQPCSRAVAPCLPEETNIIYSSCDVESKWQQGVGGAVFRTLSAGLASKSLLGRVLSSGPVDLGREYVVVVVADYEVGVRLWQ
jgi:hypothetical protein